MDMGCIHNGKEKTGNEKIKYPENPRIPRIMIQLNKDPAKINDR